MGDKVRCLWSGLLNKGGRGYLHNAGSCSAPLVADKRGDEALSATMGRSLQSKFLRNDMLMH